MRRPTLCCAIADTGKRCRGKAVKDARVRVDTNWCAGDKVHHDEFVQVPLCRHHVGLEFKL